MDAETTQTLQALRKDVTQVSESLRKVETAVVKVALPEEPVQEIPREP